MQFSPFLSINLLNSDSLDLNPLILTDMTVMFLLNVICLVLIGGDQPEIGIVGA